MQNFFSSVMPGGGQGQDASAPGPNDDVPWWMKYAGKGVGLVGGGVAMFFGVWCSITISPMCIVAGIWQFLAGFAVIVIEAPFCCMFLDAVQRFSAMVENRPPWQRALLYLVICFPPLMMCLGLSTVVGSGCIFVTSVIYGMMTLGKKASREEMSAAAASGIGKGDSMSSGLVGNIQGQDVEAARLPKK